MKSTNRKALFGLTLFLILFPVVAMNVSAIGHYLDIMIFVGIYCLINMGLSLLMGYAGQISLGHAAFLVWEPMLREYSVPSSPCRLGWQWLRALESQRW